MAQRQPTTTTKEGVQLSWRWILGLVIFALALTFIVQNRQTVGVYLFTTTVNGPMWVALAVMLVIGILVGFLLGLRRRH